MKNLNYSQLKGIFNDCQLPISFIFLDELDKNISQFISQSGDKQIRVATKSIRSFDVLNHIKSKLGEKYVGVMAYHLDEAIDLASKGEKNIMMGYPQLPHSRQFRELEKYSNQIIHMCDNHQHILELDKIASNLNTTFHICLDLDMSYYLPMLHFGVLRSSLKDTSQLDHLFKTLSGCKSVKLNSLMGYEAQNAGVYDDHKNKLLGMIIRFLKKKSWKNILKVRKDFVDKISSKYKIDYVNGGGTGSILETAQDPSVNEITIGSGFYCPHLFDRYKNKFLPASGYAVAVSRIPKSDHITCHGGGYVASGACNIDKLPIVHSPSDCKFLPNEMFGEVQTPLKTSEKLSIGDPVFLRHSKAGELFERFNTIKIVRNKKVVEEWKSYRGEGKCYL